MAKKEKDEQTKDKAPKDLKTALSALNKQYGTGTISTLGGPIRPVAVFSTQVPSIDNAFGCGGIPYGRIMEVYGPESGGKTTTALQFAAACQQAMVPHYERKGRVAFIDTEHALDPNWARKIGVNLDDMIFSQPSNGEEAFDILETLAKTREIDLAIVDSVAAMLPKDVIDGEVSDSGIGQHARLMSKGIGKIKGICFHNKMTVLFINQIREKIGVMFGNPETTPGGRALKFYSSIRAEIRRGAKLGGKDELTGFTTNCKIIKNKLAPPFRTATYDIMFTNEISGIDRFAAIFDAASEAGVIEKSGSWFSFKSERLGLGREAALAAIRGNEKWQENIVAAYRLKMFGPTDPTKLNALTEDEPNEDTDEDDPILDQP